MRGTFTWVKVGVRAETAKYSTPDQNVGHYTGANVSVWLVAVSKKFPLSSPSNQNRSIFTCFNRDIQLVTANASATVRDVTPFNWPDRGVVLVTVNDFSLVKIRAEAARKEGGEGGEGGRGAGGCVGQRFARAERFLKLRFPFWFPRVFECCSSCISIDDAALHFLLTVFVSCLPLSSASLLPLSNSKACFIQFPLPL